MRQYRLVDSDTHMIYPKDMWSRWLPQKLQESAPRLVRDAAGGDAWQIDPAMPAEPLGLTFTAGKPPEEHKWAGYTYEDIRAGAWDAQARIKDMTYDGVDAQVVYSDNRTMGQVLALKDQERQMALIQAYNNWLMQDFCAADPERLIGLTQIPKAGIEASISEMKRGKKMGARGVLLRNWPSGGPSLSPADDPFWQACVDEQMPIGIHLAFSQGASGVQSPMSGKTKAALGAVSMPGISAIIIQTIFDGLFDRFPELKISSVETGAGWVPFLLEQLDDKYWRCRHWANLDMQLLPSDYWARNWSVTFVIDKFGVRSRHAVGVDNMMWSTDYPHNSCDWPYSRRVMSDTFADVPQDEKDKIVGLNCARWYHLV